jgi:regulator of protease activity HflC (stomatin/prohibitin superfamily)
MEIIFNKKIIFSIVIILVLFIVIFNAFGIVPAGHRGVLLQFGAVTGKVFDEGLYVKIPFIQRVVKMDIRIQKEQVNAEASSKDLQIVNAVVALNFHLMPDKVSEIYRSIGIDYKSKVIDPIIQETFKASTAKFTAEELITRREEVREKTKLLLEEKLSTKGIKVDEFNIINFDFSKAFNEAIEAKVVAEQQALAAKNKLEQVKFEAQQTIEAAKGKAQAIQIEGEMLSKYPNVVQLKWIEKWDGKVPMFWGQATPFVGIPNK